MTGFANSCNDMCWAEAFLNLEGGRHSGSGSLLRWYYTLSARTVFLTWGWGWISPEIDWYNFLYGCPATMWLFRHKYTFFNFQKWQKSLGGWEQDQDTVGGGGKDIFRFKMYVAIMWARTTIIWSKIFYLNNGFSTLIWCSIHSQSPKGLGKGSTKIIFSLNFPWAGVPPSVKIIIFLEKI